MKPTKFDLMRANRRAIENRAFYAGMGVWGEETVSAAPAPAPAVPTMEIDGVRYREAPPKDPTNCDGCALVGRDKGCFVGPNAVSLYSVPVFGGECAERSVIYIKAE